MLRIRFVIVALVVAMALYGFGAVAAYAPVEDGAKILSDAAISRTTSMISEIKRSVNKDVWVVIAPSLGGKDRKAAADEAFVARGATGIMIYVAFKEKVISVRVGDKTRTLFNDAKVAQIRDTLKTNFKAGRYDDGVVEAVRVVQDTFTYAASASTRSGARSAAPVTRAEPKKSGGSGWLWIVIVMVVLFIGFLIIVGIIRAIFGLFAGRQAPGGPDPGYGGNYGGGYGPPAGGGGGFWSGMLGGLGGAVLGNAAYDWFRGRDSHGAHAGEQSSSFDDGGSTWQQPDTGGSFSSDDSGSWDSGGGGGFDSGGGDSGGGGGDW